MSVNIVDLLKSIEVHAQNSETSALSLCQSQRRGQTLIEGGSIWKIRKRIAMRHTRDTLLRPPALCHIIDQGQNIFRFSIVTLDGNLLRGDEPNSPFGCRNLMIGNNDRVIGEQRFPVLSYNKISAFFVVYIVRCFADNEVTVKSE